MNQEFRVNTFDDFIGQEKLIKTLKIIIASAKEQTRPIDHLLFYGPPGLGKTSLAKIIANELNGSIVYVQGPMIEKKSDILTIFSSIKDNDIIFIDEIHSINKNVEELFYSALEDRVIDIALGVEGNKKIMRLNLKNFSLIGATTKLNLVSKPLKDRFGYIGKLLPYNSEEIKNIILNSAKRNNISITEEAANYIAIHSRQTPRIANNLLKRVNDFSIFNKQDKITVQIVKNSFKYLDVHMFGLYQPQIEYLKTLKNIFKEKFASLETISSITRDDKYTILNEIEPLLIVNNLIEKGPRGRRITKEGSKYLSDLDII
ncbi:Holliday junction branch migration DNA helicase RuvB [[Mycoplasma] falconis]|uniref:Holliday junction branch migration complex subunit RuvB n=1 Tax=[Mycoplasma] falconis TaxID=92403 RepID=A0A501XA74_9BACT|nr:Holliday junction branch migration DNA helicase RuvB [[Mycoplasma] falconis]TPE57432.1 Holliday junction branch migration DNA helicase RuvB [[Mycoplasma] falconis]